VLLCLDGAGSYFRGMADRFGKARDELPFLVVAPCTFSNTDARREPLRTKYQQWYSDELIDGLTDQARLDWDEAGLMAVLDDLRAEYDAEPQAYVAAFSGGGIAAYMLVFKHPDRVAAAALQSANFFQPEYRSLKGRFPRDELRFPIRVLLGDRDPYVPLNEAGRMFGAAWQAFAAFVGAGLLVAGLAWWRTRKLRWVIGAGAVTLLGVVMVAVDMSRSIGAQNEAALGLLEELGYEDVRQEWLPGVGHDLDAEALMEVLRGCWER
jgi:pimeloyl-ACP methyl ester carboxylesterase